MVKRKLFMSMIGCDICRNFYIKPKRFVNSNQIYPVLIFNHSQDDIKDIQKTLVDQLIKQLFSQNGNPSRRLIAKCLAMIFTVGDTFLLFDTVNKFIETLKNKDDSAVISNSKLSSIICIGIMYENLGRLMGRTYEETVQSLLKLLKNVDVNSNISQFTL